MDLINEKTLELNISIEILESIRENHDLDCYLYAVSQRSEKDAGYDFALRLPNREDAFICFFQIKKAYYLREDGFYNFYINNNSQHNQHKVLFDLSHRFSRETIFYAFPLIINLKELERNIHNLRYRTVFPPINFIKIENEFISHRIEIHPNCLRELRLNDCFRIHSNINKAYLYKDIISKIETNKIGITLQEFIAKMNILSNNLSIQEKRILNNSLNKSICYIYK